jgi:hypothetical protein
MSEIAKRITAVVDEGLSSLLKKEGFRKRGINYYRTDGDAMQVVTVQSSQGNFGDSGRFRVNFGVHFPAVAKVLDGSDPMPEVPKEPYCILRATWSFPDRWWTVDPTTDVTMIADKLRAYWQEVVWPWLETNKFLPKAAATLESQLVGQMAAAAARLVLGERNEAARLVRACIAGLESSLETAHPAYYLEIQTAQLQKVREWAADHQLL